MLRASLLSIVLAGSVAYAEGLPARNGEEVRLNVNQRSRKAVRLRPSPSGDGWRLELGATSANGLADVFDITPGTPARTLAVAVHAGSMLFDRARFAGGHAYRVQLRSDGKATASGFVLLVAEAPAKEPPRRAVRRLRFSTDEAPAADAPLQVLKKAPL